MQKSLVLVIAVGAVVILAAFFVVGATTTPVKVTYDDFVYTYDIGDKIVYENDVWIVRGYLLDQSLVDGKKRHYYRVYKYAEEKYYVENYVWTGYVDGYYTKDGGNEGEDDPPPPDCPVPPC